MDCRSRAFSIKATLALLVTGTGQASDHVHISLQHEELARGKMSSDSLYNSGIVSPAMHGCFEKVGRAC